VIELWHLGQARVVGGRGDGRALLKKPACWVDVRRSWTVLDAGCVLGGAAFYVGRELGVEVHGIQLSREMIAIARERLAEELVETSGLADQSGRP
jgi:cyclopropane fatty-acyl-phospholipid synthase-like methyltransferase